MNIPSVPITANPVLLEKAAASLQAHLKTKLAWLNHSFGVVQRLTKLQNLVKVRYPGLYLETTKSYIDLTPTQEFTNFCFITIDDPQGITLSNVDKIDISTQASIVFWLDLSKTIFTTPEQAKLSILDALKTSSRNDTRFSVEKVYVEAKNIYKDFDLQETDHQFLLRPFTGFRFEGLLTAKQRC